MHRGCLVWTPSPPLLGRRTPRPGPVHVCVCSSILTRLGGPACRARCGAPHLFLWPVLLHSLFAPPPPCWGRPFFSFLFVRSGCPWRFLLSGPGCPLLVCCPPPFFFPAPPPFSFSLCAPVVSGVPCFPARGALGLGVFLSPPPPPFSFFFSCFHSLLLFLLPWLFLFFAFFSLFAPVVSCVPCLPAWGALCLGFSLSPPPSLFLFFLFCFSSVFFFFLLHWLSSFAPLLSLAFLVFRPRVPLALTPCCRPRPPPPCCFFLPVCFLLFFFFSSTVPCQWCGAGLVCVSWAVGCAGVCFGGAVPVVALCAVLSRPSGAGWCCVVLPVVFVCLLFGLAVLRCILVGPGVVFPWCCPCPAAWSTEGNTLPTQRTPLPGKPPPPHAAEPLGGLSGCPPGRPRRGHRQADGPHRPALLRQRPRDSPPRGAPLARPLPVAPTGTGGFTRPRHPPVQEDQNRSGGPPARPPAGRNTPTGARVQPHRTTPRPDPRGTPKAPPPPAPTTTTVPQHPNPAAQPVTTTHTRPHHARTTIRAEPGYMAPQTPPLRPRPPQPLPPDAPILRHLTPAASPTRPSTAGPHEPPTPHGTRHRTTPSRIPPPPAPTTTTTNAGVPHTASTPSTPTPRGPAPPAAPTTLAQDTRATVHAHQQHQGLV